MPRPEDPFDSISPADYRYWDPQVAEYLSENASTKAKLRVEVELVRVLAELGLCSPAVLAEVEQACSEVTTEEVYREEDRIKHDIRALVNCIRARVSDEAKPFVHRCATSFDIIDTANAWRYQQVYREVLLSALRELIQTLADLAKREAGTVQIGRTHGQHAVPITFGFAIAGYAYRLVGSYVELRQKSDRLEGKISGAVGAYNASALLLADPVAYEAKVLRGLGLRPAIHSTQIAPPEPLARLLSETVVMMGVVANLARDMRNLQRTEIAEVGEPFGKAQVGSSAMPQKRNPINFENIESNWKIILPRILTVFMDQVSEHQRDLTNSASGRTYAEVVEYAVHALKRMNSMMSKLVVDRENMERNLAMTQGMVLAEPLQVLLASYGHPDSHEAVRLLTLRAQAEELSLVEAIQDTPDIAEWVARMDESQQAILRDPSAYTGIAKGKTLAVVEHTLNRLRLS